MTSESQEVGPSSGKNQKNDRNERKDALRQLSNSPIGEATAFGALGLGIFIFMQKVVIAK
ncbi:MAG: hypothetical protein CVV48_11455 [Spirochaetae bacterium HGW-Spirochaetae-4]|jgi:hypothetical protein|nr:MAG: hypothetical protein CVV48_11455 [Spirochaetae bacterium HGW-Spirochaetae-4]